MATKSIQGLLALAAMAGFTAAAAQSPSLEALERAFWRCDHAATQVALDSGEAMECSLATEALKVRRFGGDFTLMLAWWRANREAQHLALSAAAAAATQRLASVKPRP